MSITCMGTCCSHITPALSCASNIWLQVNDGLLPLPPQRSAGRHGHIQPLRKDQDVCWLEQGQQATVPQDGNQHEEGQLHYVWCYKYGKKDECWQGMGGSLVSRPFLTTIVFCAHSWRTATMLWIWAKRQSSLSLASAGRTCSTATTHSLWHWCGSWWGGETLVIIKNLKEPHSHC